MTEETAKSMLIEVNSTKGSITSENIKKHFNIRSFEKIQNLMRSARRLHEQGILKRLDRGKYTMNTDTMKEQKIIDKVEKAIKLGKHIILKGAKINGSEIIRMGAPEKIIMSKDGKRSLRMKDTLQSSWRTYRLDLVDSIKFAQ